MKKISLFLVVATFLITQVCLAAIVDPAKIVIPRDKGRIVEMHTAKGANAPFIAYIQDIHVNYEAQKAEAGILEALIRDYGFDLVLMEGKQGDNAADLKKYRNEAKAVREAAGDELLRNGALYGAHYLDLVSDYDFTIQGIEDMGLYKKETEDHAAIIGKSADMGALVKRLQGVTSNLKLHIYTKEMRDLDEKITAYDNDEIGLVEHVKYLEGAAKANGIDIKGVANVALFIESAGLEDQIDFVAVETEREEAVDAIEAALSEKAKEELLAKSLQFRTGEISQGEFYTYIKDTAKTAKVDISGHKNLTAYTQYISTYEKIDTVALFKEIDQLVDKVKVVLVKTPEQKKLSEIDKGLAIISGFVNTKLVPDEFNYFEKKKADFNLKGWLEFLKNNSSKFGLTTPVPDDISILEANLPLFERFYSDSFKRDAAFIKNIEANLKKYNKDKAVLITGGFHTPNMTKLLKDNGYSYVVVSPRIDIIKDYSDLYKERLKLDIEYVGKMKPAAPSMQAGNNRQVMDAIGRGDITTIDAALARHRELAGQEATAQERAEYETALRRYAEGRGIGKYKIESATPNADRTALIATLVHIETGERLENVEIGIERALTRAEIMERINALGLVNPIYGDLISRNVDSALGRLGNNVFVLRDNPYGIGGIGTGALASIGASIVGNAVSNVHELFESEGSVNIGLLGQILGVLNSDQNLITTDEGTQMRAVDWYNQMIAGEGRAEIRLHYAIRALTRAAYGDQDIALTRMIRVRVNAYDAAKQVVDTLQGRTYRLFAPSIPEVRAVAENATFDERFLTNHGAEGRVSYFADLNHLNTLVGNAIANNQVPLVAVTLEQAQEIAANPSRYTNLAGVALEVVGNFAATTNSIDALFTELVLQDNTNRQIVEQGMTIEQVQRSVTFRALQALRSSMTNTDMTVEAITGLLVKSPTTDDLKTRTDNALKLPVLPRAEALSPSREQELRASLSIMLSA